MSGYTAEGSYFATKFDSARDEYLWTMAWGGWANDHDGEVDSPTGYFSRIVNNRYDLPEIIEAFGDLYTRKAVISNGELEGNFLISENSQGHVFVESFASEAELDVAYEQNVEDYSYWLDMYDESDPDA